MMYANMSEEEVFLRNVVNDSRSYKDETFEKALRLLQNPKKGVTMDAARVDKFQLMVAKLKALKSEIDFEEVRTIECSNCFVIGHVRRRTRGAAGPNYEHTHEGACAAAFLRHHH